jgi:hypothetical protein
MREKRVGSRDQDWVETNEAFNWKVLSTENV